jgi:hypothetical protein
MVEQRTFNPASLSAVLTCEDTGPSRAQPHKSDALIAPVLATLLAEASASYPTHRTLLARMGTAPMSACYTGRMARVTSCPTRPGAHVAGDQTQKALRCNKRRDDRYGHRRQALDPTYKIQIRDWRSPQPRALTAISQGAPQVVV